ncbi:MAG: TIGR03435 family protein, partial [Candidatus Dormibacteraceae bacterium]
FHKDNQLYPAMALTLDPKGPPPTPSDPTYNMQGNPIGRQEGGDIVFHFSGATMAQFLGFIMNLFQDKQLVDETGLTGTYDITLRIPATSFEGPGDRGPNDERGPAFINAAQQVGFKFVNKKISLPIVVVDHIDPPTPN